MEIRALRPSDDRTAFASGDPDLDRFLMRFAGQNQFRHHLGVTYVAVEDDRILGYATISPGHVEIDAMPITRRRKLPQHPLPVLRLARLAVDASVQGRGVGSAILGFVLRLALEMAGAFGCTGIVVDAKPCAFVCACR